MSYKMSTLKSPVDDRDYIFSEFISVKDLPNKFIYDDLPIKNQKDQGWCVGFASSTIKDKQERIDNAYKNYITSPTFIYTECKKIDGIPKIEGTYPRVAMKVLKNLGTCLESTLPFRNTPQLPQITQQMYEEAKQFKIKAYARVNTVVEMKQAIYSSSPLLSVVVVTDSFVNPQNGFVDLPKGNYIGTHAVVLDGFNDNLTHTYPDGKTRKGFFRIVNSWGNWGDHGYAWLPYDFVTLRTDLGMSFVTESWASIDVDDFTSPYRKLTLWIGNDTVMADDKPLRLEQVPIVDKNSSRTLLPLRQICELLGQRVRWIESDRRIEIGKNIKLWIDKKEALVNDKSVPLDQAPYIDPNTWRTLIPVRFVSEVLGYNVQWFAEDKRIEITKK